MGLLNIIFIPLSWFDKIFALIFSPIIRLLLWGIAASFSSMSIYSRMSHQDKLSYIKNEISQTKKALLKYDGEFSGACHLIKKNLLLSLKQIRYQLLPTFLGAVPFIILLIWVGNTYSYNLPNHGSLIQIRTYPSGVNMISNDNALLISLNTTFDIPWPNPEEPIKITDSGNQAIATLPLKYPIPILHKYKLWNILLGNPNGYIPKISPVNKIEIKLPQKVYINSKWKWIRSAEFIFILSAFICSLLIKLIFRIH